MKRRALKKRISTMFNKATREYLARELANRYRSGEE